MIRLHSGFLTQMETDTAEFKFRPEFKYRNEENVWTIIVWMYSVLFSSGLNTAIDCLVFSISRTNCKRI